MEDIRIDVGVYTLLKVKLSNAKFTEGMSIVLTIKNSLDPNAPAIIEKTYTKAEDCDLEITPEESLQLTSGAMYDFNKVIDGKRYKISDNGRIILRKGVGDNLD
jgi:hypothetical protein